MVTEVPVSKLLPDQPKSLFRERASATMERCAELYTRRGDHFGDTWRDCKWIKLKAILFTMFGMKPTTSQCRALGLASFADMKYWRHLSGYEEDSQLDGINYDAALAEEMREVYKEPAKAFGNEICCTNPIDNRVQVRVNGEWKDL